MGRSDLRPRLRADGGDGPRGAGAARAARRRDRRRRRLRFGPDHRGAARAAAARPRDRRRRRAVDDRGRARAARRAREPRAARRRSCELELGRPADAILSTATFHWIKDHAQLFGRLRAALRDGGRARRPVRRARQHPRRARARRGGRARGAVRRAPRRTGTGPWRYAAPDETEELLPAAGFASANCWLEQRPVEPEDLPTYYRNIIMGAHLGRLPDGAPRRRSSTRCWRGSRSRA